MRETGAMWHVGFLAGKPRIQKPKKPLKMGNISARFPTKSARMPHRTCFTRLLVHARALVFGDIPLISAVSARGVAWGRAPPS